MLTELFSDYSSEIAAARDSLLVLAPSFGQGLQMTNILKDVWEDQERGACWLPRDIFLENGFDLQDLGRSAYTPGFGASLTELVAITHGHLKNALEYTLLIPRKESGIRKFCLWGIGMAVLTLRNIHRLPQYRNAEQIKISRREVKKIILVSNMWVKNDFMLRKAFRIAGRGLPIREEKPGAGWSVWRAPEGASLFYQEV
jgi:farnesyl-diphosphate farnesyltransferase